MPDDRVAPALSTGFVAIEVDGCALSAEPGISVAAALWQHDIRHLRQSPSGQSRGAFCMMGVCQECVVHIDQRLVRACVTPVHGGMQIVTARRP